MDNIVETLFFGSKSDIANGIKKKYQNKLVAIDEILIDSSYINLFYSFTDISGEIWDRGISYER